MQPQSLSNAWKRKSYLRLLSGLTLEPSMADLGVASWIASQAVIRASHSRWPARCSAVTIPDTCGPTSLESFEKSNRQDVSLKTSPTIFEWATNKSTMTFKRWVTQLRRACLRRRKSERRIEEKDSSFWPTPRSQEGHTAKHGLIWVENGYKPANFRLNRNGEVVFMKGGGNFDTTLKAASMGWTITFFRRHPEMTCPGRTSSQQIPKYNPLFIEWMMGLPPGWTDIRPVATPLSHWLRRMRGRFLEMHSTHEINRHYHQVDGK
jgi:hypothetical protein